MVSPGKIYIWNETDWDLDRCIELRSNAETCSLLFYDAGLDPDLAVLGEISVSPGMLAAAAKGCDCDLVDEEGRVEIRRRRDWTFLRFQFDDFPLAAEWQVGALWFQSAVFNCLSAHGGDSGYLA